MTNSSPIDVYVSHASSSWCNLIICSLVLYRFWDGSLVSKKWFETRQNEQRRKGLTWCHAMKDQEFHIPQLTTLDAKQQQLRNNYSRCRQVLYLFPAIFLYSLFQASLLLSVIRNKQNNYQGFVSWWVPLPQVIVN